MIEQFVLDAWALLALLQAEEPAASRVKQLFLAADQRQAGLSMSIVNVGEVYYRIGKVRGRREAVETLETIRHLPLTIISASDELVLAAADLKMKYSISYADAFAVATAEATSAILVTGDPEIDQLEDRIRIEKLHRHNN